MSGASADLVARARRDGRALALRTVIAARQASPARRGPPDYIVIGAQKAGTSTLAARLAAHPQVLPPLRREVHYFDFAHARPRSWYEAHFATLARRRRVAQRHARAITGEASPFYLVHPAVPARVQSLYPDVRLIALLREPASRAVSEYHHAVRHGFERRSIEDALAVRADASTDARPDDRAYDDPNGAIRRYSYVERGHYAEQLERWYERFPREQLLVLTSEELRAGTAMQRIHRFLGLDDLPVRHVEDQNVHPHRGAPEPVLEALRAHYAPHNARLATLLGRSFPWEGGG